jgi:hypothetical protein
LLTEQTSFRQEFAKNRRSGIILTTFVAVLLGSFYNGVRSPGATRDELARAARAAER